MAEIISGLKRKHGVSASLKVTQLQIDRIVGLSIPNSGTVAYCPSHANLLCYPAGSFAIVYDSSTKQQLNLLRSTTSNAAVHCVAWSSTGDHIAAGEAGANPSILIWDWSQTKCLHELKAHKQTIVSTRFAPDGKLLLSAGGAHDGQLCLWDWRAGTLLWKQNVASELNSAAFTEDSSCILAVGRAIFKAWSVNNSAQIPRGKSSVGSTSNASNSLSLTPRPVTLRELQRSAFVDVCMAPCLPSQPAGNNGVYALVESGVLVLMRPTGRTIDKSVNLQVRAAFALAAAPTQVAAACSQGVVRLFSSKTLAFKATLPRFVAKGQGQAADADFPDARSCSFHPGTEHQLVVAYSDMSIIIWDLSDTKKITCMLTLAAHSTCIWDVCSVSPPAFDVGGIQPPQSPMPARCATCAADGTVRLWNLASDAAPGTGRLLAAASAAVGKPAAQLRCMRVSPNGRQICVGDQAGNVRVYDSVTYKLIVQQAAHDDEVLSLDYSPMSSDGGCLAASGSRDMLIHIYDAQHGYELLETLDDHTAAVTGVRFTGGGKGLVSCGADRSIIFRVLGGADGSTAAYHIETLPHSVLYDLAVDPLDQYVFTTGQDGLLRQWDVASGSLQRTLSPEAGAGEPIKLCIDPGGVVLICCHADGCLRLYHLASGQLLWRAWGHSEMVSAASLTSDLTKMVSVGGDGCVIAWKLPEQLVQEMQAAVARVTAAKQRLETTSKTHQQQQSQQCMEPTEQHNAWTARKRLAWDAGPSPAVVAGSPQHVNAVLATPPPTSSDATNLSVAGTSDSGISSTLLRVRQGKPLVSTDKLPKWARSPTQGGPVSPQSTSGDGATQQQQQQQQRQQQQILNRWFGPNNVSNESKWQTTRQLALPDDTAPPSADKIEDAQACRQLSLESGSATADGSRRTTDKLSDADDAHVGDSDLDEEQQQQSPAWPQEDDMVVIQDWDDSSLVQYTAQAAAAAEEPNITAVEAEAADEEMAVQQQQPSIQPSDQIGTRVVRDLFKEHFSSLGGAEPSGLQRQSHEFRQSLSAMFKAGRSSLGGMPLRHQGLSSAGGIIQAAGVSNADIETAAPPISLSTVDGAEAEGQAASDIATDPAQQVVAAAEGPVDAVVIGDGDEPLTAGQPKKRWRHGKMDAELAGMRERLANLQALYQQQMLQRQLSPRRGRSYSSTDDQIQQAAKLAVQQGVSLSEPGSSKKLKVSTDTENNLADSTQTEAAIDSSLPASSTITASDSTSASSSGSATKMYEEAEVVVSAPPVAAAVAAATVAPQSRTPSKVAVVPGATTPPPPLPPGPVPPAALKSADKPKTYAAAAGAAVSIPATQQQHIATSAADASVTPAQQAGAVQPDGTDAAEGEDETYEDDFEQYYTPLSPTSHTPAADTTAVGSVTSSTPVSPAALPTEDAPDSLLVQLLADSPELPSLETANSPELGSGEETIESQGPPRATDIVAKFDEVASPGRQGSNTQANNTDAPQAASGLSPTWLQSHSNSLFGDSVYRVSIGTSIAAVDSTAGGTNANIAEPARPGSPTRWSLSLQVPRAFADSQGHVSLQSPTAARSPSRLNPCSTSHTGCEEVGKGAENKAAADTGNKAHSAQQQLASSTGPADDGGTYCRLSEQAASQGVTITPQGQHTVWPGWGEEPVWEGLTPSPVALSIIPKLETSMALAAAVNDESANETSSAIEQARAAASSLAAEARVYLQQNPCYDMTPIGSTPGSAVASSNGRASCAGNLQFGADADGAVAVAGQSAATAPVAGDCQHNNTGSQLSQHTEQIPAAEPNVPQHLKQRQQVPAYLQQKQLDEPEVMQQLQQAVFQKEPAPQQHQLQQLPVHPQGLPDASHCTPQEHSDILSNNSSPPAAASTPISPVSTHATPRSGLFSSPASPVGSSSKSKSQAKREKAAAKAAAKAAKAAAAAEHSEHGSPSVSSPGSSMMSLLQRIKRTMPSIRSRPSSSGGGSSSSGGGFSCASAKAISTYSPDKTPRLNSSSDGTLQQGHNSMQTADDKQPSSAFDTDLLNACAPSNNQLQLMHANTKEVDSGPVSLDDVRLEMGQEVAAKESADHAVVAPSLAQQPQVRSSVVAGADVVAAAAPEDASSARRPPTVAQVAATVEQFKQSVHEVQQLWLQLQNLSLNQQEACQLQQLLTPPHKAAAGNAVAGSSATMGSNCAAADRAARSSSGPLQQPPVADPSSLNGAQQQPQHSSAEPVKHVKQMLQEELLHSIWGLHATVTGSAAGKQTPPGFVQFGTGHNSPPRTPLYTNGSTSPLQPWQMHSVSSSQQQGYAFGSPAGSVQMSAGQTAAGSSEARAPHVFTADITGSGNVSGGVEFAPGSPAWSAYSMRSQATVQLEELISNTCEQFAERLLLKLEERKAQQRRDERKHSPVKQQQHHQQQQASKHHEHVQ